MSERSDASQELVRAILEGVGMTVEPIPVQKGKRTADYLVSDTAHRYLVEVTDREPDADYKAFFRELASEGVSMLTRPVGTSKRLDDFVVEKAAQLRKTPIEASFNIAWITALHYDDELMVEELFRTLYGVAQLRTIKNPYDFAEWPGKTFDCYYYLPFSLRLETDIHGVGFASTDRTALFVNPFADNADSFRRSGLAHAFANINRLHDPEDEKAKLEALHVPPDVEWTSKALHKALREKYGLFTWPSPETLLQQQILIPKK